eukprot:10221622-Karenia_brevis.AAC.1
MSEFGFEKDKIKEKFASPGGEWPLPIQVARTNIVIVLDPSSYTAAPFRGGFGYPLLSGGMWMHAL